MIVDEADAEIEMANDPFVEAGIEFPVNLPYKDISQHEMSYKKVVGDEQAKNLRANAIRKLTDVDSMNLNSDIKVSTERKNGIADNHHWRNGQILT